ncbi:unnamed protein product, partial [Toxocara canis]|uniref:DUF1758 domain-containing protein n=1 Tax=Toxocara canis TaxID=6265 RepID=A0A183U850_TOXCA
MSHLKQGKIQAYVEETSCQKPILEYENVTPNILIGADLMWDIFEPQPITELTSHLFLVPTKFGPILTGRATSQKSFLETSKDNNTPLQCSSLIKHEELNLDQYWNLESIGITDPPNQKDDDEALRQFYKSVSLVDGRYTVSWPWRDTPPKFPLRDNYQLSVGRLRSLIKRLSVDSNLLRKYDDTIKEQLSQQIIERCDTNKADGSVIHYLPHHPIIRPDKSTTKLRIVYDASAKANQRSSSLNECLLPGPSLLPDLCGLLLRFRVKPIVLLADVEKAFLQLELFPADRDVTRFLWLKEPDEGFSMENIQCYRFKRVPFGIVSSPFLLNAVIRHHLQTTGTATAQQILQGIYVDN